MSRATLCGLVLLLGAPAAADQPLHVAGIYPHLAVFSTNGEVGIGAVVPWAERLWTITYPPHHTAGGSDKLYEIDAALRMVIRPESVGGTHACRMIHRESNQLIIGPYFIDARRNVRACDLKQLRGRMTAVARHLTDPANRVYFFDMEGAIYEVDVHTLAVTRLFEKPVPGWHGKGGYTAQGRLVIANNGEVAVGKKQRTYLAGSDAGGPEDAGVLAEWDGRQWRIVERRQFTDVTGPGGIYGSPDDTSPLWAIGWDKRSVLLKLLDGGRWHTFRVPKASHAYDPRHGWYTEWPRIRAVADGQLMMDVHGMYYRFPQGFSAAATGGIRPIASHLRYVPDFCQWNDRLVVASDDASLMQNPMVGQSQSNLWFGRTAELERFGPRSGWGGVWCGDDVRANEPSAPLLVAGFDRRLVHLAHDAALAVRFSLEGDEAGDGQWRPLASVEVPANGYAAHALPADAKATWVRVRTNVDCKATAYFHLTSLRNAADDAADFQALAAAGDASATVGLIRPAGHNRNLQFLRVSPRGKRSYFEVDEGLRFVQPAEDRGDEVAKVAAIARDFEVDEASVVIVRKTGRYRLPKGPAAFDAPSAAGWPRAIRECVSERFLMNVHGTFYELPRDNGLPYIKPVSSHGRQIFDFCTWRGLLVLSGVRADAKPEGRFFGPDGGGLWFGQIDDLWRLGKPVGRGGPWKNTAVTAGEVSDPYLMTGYDRKRLELSHDAAGDVAVTLEVDFDHRQWRTYKSWKVAAGKTLVYDFPAGYSAHWVRFRADRPCRATATLIYE